MPMVKFLKKLQERLLEMGKWIDVNREAIYETRTWKIYGEGPQEIVEGHLSENENPEATAEDIRFTTKGNNLYAIALDWPGKKMLIRSFAKEKNLLKKSIRKIELLGSEGELDWNLSEEGLEVLLPADKPCEHAFAFKIELRE